MANCLAVVFRALLNRIISNGRNNYNLLSKRRFEFLSVVPSNMIYASRRYLVLLFHVTHFITLKNYRLLQTCFNYQLNAQFMNKWMLEHLLCCIVTDNCIKRLSVRSIIRYRANSFNFIFEFPCIISLYFILYKELLMMDAVNVRNM
jgi:hypothetical protein